MTGAGGLVLANYLYKRAEPDGLTIGTFNNSLIVQKALGDPRIRMDFKNSAGSEPPVWALRSAW
jgi:hypothetical protein